MALESEADKLKAQGKDDTAVRRAIQKDARLSDQEASLLKQVARQCNAASDAEIIAGCMQQLQTGMGTERFLFLRLHALVHFASNLKQGAPPPVATGAATPAVPDPNLIRSVHPVSDAADVLRQNYRKVITYEDPLWEWPGEMMAGSPRTAPDKKGAWSPGWVSFTLPTAASPAPELPARLAQVLAAFHQQTEGPRFQILTSSYGLHIVPLQVRDRSGAFAPARNPLDERVLIPQQERTARGHVDALVSAMVAANGALRIIFTPRLVSTARDDFNDLFAATPAENQPFVWGTANANMIARDALIDLLEHSATTQFWDLACTGTGSFRYNVCTMTAGAVEIVTAGPDGRLARKQITYDRCGGCVGGRPR